MAKKHKGMITGEPVTYQIPAPADGVQIETFIPWTLVKRGVKRQVITPIDAPEHFEKEAVVERSALKQVTDSPSIRALGLAHYWQRLLDEGKYQSLTQIAMAENMDLGRASRIAQLIRLTPQIVESCLPDHANTPSLDRLIRACNTNTWAEQAAFISDVKLQS